MTNAYTLHSGQRVGYSTAQEARPVQGDTAPKQPLSCYAAPFSGHSPRLPAGEHFFDDLRVVSARRRPARLPEDLPETHFAGAQPSEELQPKL
jgi:hypothetical protein